MKNKQIFAHILDYLRSYKQQVVIVLIALGCVSISMLSLGRAVKMLIDEGLRSNDAASLDEALAFIVFLILSLGIASFFRSYFINSIGERVVSDIRQKVYCHLLELQFRQFEQIKVSDIVTRLSSDLELISRIIIDIFSFCIRNSLMFLGGLIMMFTESTKLALVVLFVVPIIALSLALLSKVVRSLSRSASYSATKLIDQINETFSAVQTIYATNNQKMKKQELSRSSDEFMLICLKRLQMRAMFFAFAITAIMCSVAFVVWLGSRDVLAGSLSSGQLVAFIFYAISSAVSLGGIAEVVGDLQRYLSAAERVFTLLEIDDMETGSNNITLSNKSPIIKFCKVSFTYPSRPDAEVLSSISFEINRGEFIAFVGPSGSGKSTIMQLLLRFFSVSSGEILLEDKNIQDIKPADLRKIFGYVPQDPFMFANSIKYNLLLRDENDDELERVLHLSALRETISHLPDGLKTYVGEGGAQLSGGQKQRIAIARAMLRSPEILLLDEATSSLDQVSQRLIIENIRKEMKDKTIISIAHRISSIEEADRIIVVDKGSIIDSGTHEELLNSCRLYQTLCNEEYSSLVE